MIPSFVVRAIALLFCFPLAAWSQAAQVTFYSNASLAKSAIPLSGSAFYGYIFDGDLQMAEIHHGRFVTFQLPAGAHRFSAGLGKKHPPKDALSSLSIDLVAGQQYFIAASYDYDHYIIYDVRHGILTNTPCEQAQKDVGKSKLVSMKRVSQAARALLDTATRLPACKL